MNRRTPLLPTAALTAAALLFTLLPAGTATAQTAWNRHAEALSVVDDPANPALRTVHAVFEVHVGSLQSVPLDLGTDVDLSINGIVVASQTVPISADPGAGSCIDAAGCGGGCGGGHVNGATMGLLCLPEGACNPLCDCTCKFPSITASFPGMSLSPGDEIMVLLRPAPGALPETEPSDDTLAISHGGDVFWDREVTGITFTPSPLGGAFDISVDGMLFHDGLSAFAGAGTPVDLGHIVDLEVNGVPAGSVPVLLAPQPLGGSCVCLNSCALDIYATHTCQPYGAGLECKCAAPWIALFPTIPVDPGDTVRVILRPAPGALPELPGFEDDDEREDPCCGRPTGVEGVTATVTGERPIAVRPNPFRDDTTVSFTTGTDAPVTVEVFDLRGRRVRTLVPGRRVAPGVEQTARWDGRTDAGDRAGTGIYFLRVTTDGTTSTRKVALSR